MKLSIARKLLISLALSNLSSVAAFDKGEYKDDGLSRIIGGEPAPINEYPWFAMLQYVYFGTPYRRGCGGMLIHPEWVLTANHCINDDMRNNGAVTIGAFEDPYTPANNGGQFAEYFTLSDVVEHPTYDQAAWLDNDFTLLRLNGVSTIDPVPLDSTGISESYPTGKDGLWAIGLGLLEAQTNNIPDELMHVDINYVTNNDCTADYGWAPSQITDNMLCARDLGQSACNGDSGGPLYDKGNNVLIGVVSWGSTDCANSYYPGVYARVSQAYDWIVETICQPGGSSVPSPLCGPAPSAIPTTTPGPTNAVSTVPSVIPTVSQNPTIASSTVPSVIPTGATPAPSAQPSLTSCGDGICQVYLGEGCGICPLDCNGPDFCGSITNPENEWYYSSAGYGIVFDVVTGPQSLYLYELRVLLRDSFAPVKVYMKDGSYTSDSNLLNWTEVFDGTISRIDPSERDATISLSSRFFADASSTVAIYITYEWAGAFNYAPQGSLASNDDIVIQAGSIRAQLTGNTLPSSVHSPRNFLRGINYGYTLEAEPTGSPTIETSLTPTTSPSIEASSTPTGSPSIEASSTPTTSPSTKPSPGPSCSDRTDEWELDGMTKNWCEWAKKKKTQQRCSTKFLYYDCPDTCVYDHGRRFQVGNVGESRKWCKWADRKKTEERCEEKYLYGVCYETCGSICDAPPV